MNLVVLDALLSGGMLLAMLAAAALGRRLENAMARKDPSRLEAGTGIAEPAILALLGLLLAFTFGWSSTRMDYHRRLIADEANAIGTAYLRLDLVPSEAQPALRELFRQYLEERIRATSLLPWTRAVPPEPEGSARLQREIWERAQVAVKRTEWTPSAILVLPAINEMIDVTTRRRVELYSHVPFLVLLLFVGVSLCSSFLLGRTLAGPKPRNALSVVLFAVAIAVTTFVVLDLELPRAGLIRLDLAEKALQQLRDTMK